MRAKGRLGPNQQCETESCLPADRRLGCFRVEYSRAAAIQQLDGLSIGHGQAPAFEWLCELRCAHALDGRGTRMHVSYSCRWSVIACTRENACAHAQWSRASNETLLACGDGATASGGSLSLTLCQASRCCLQLPPDKVSMDDTVPST